MKNLKFFSAGQHNKYPLLGAIPIKTISFILTIFAVLAIISVASFGFINQTFADAVNTNDLEADADLADNPPSNAGTFEDGDFRFSIIDENNCCIEAYIFPGQKAYIDIPVFATNSDSKTTYKVTGIKSLQGLECETVTCSEDIDGEFTIKEYAFKNSTVKTFTFSTIHETFGNSVTPVYIIEAYAFYGCTQLKTVNFDSANITSIGYEAFRNCALTSVSFCPGITCEVGAFAFDGCTNLESIIFPSTGSISLGNCCFSCENTEKCKVTEITIDAGIASIGDLAFYSCKDLNIVNITSAAATKATPITTMSSSFTHSMKNYNSGYEIINKETITVSGKFVKNCSDLEFSVTAFYQVFQLSGNTKTVFGNPQTALSDVSVTFYQSKTERGQATSDTDGNYVINDVFCGLTGVVKAKDAVSGRLHDDPNPLNISQNIVADVPNLNFAFTEYLYDESGVEYVIGSTVYVRGYTGTLPPSVTLKDSVTSNDDGKDYKVTYVGEGAFENTTSLQEVILGAGDGSNIKAIGKNAFKNSGLTKLKTNRVETIGESAFANNAKLADLYIAVWCKEVSANAFTSCTALRTVTFENAGSAGVKIGVGAFPFNYWDYVKTNADTYEYKKVIDKEATAQQTYIQTSANSKFIYDETGFGDKGADLYRVYKVSGTAHTNAKNLPIPDLKVSLDFKASDDRTITYSNTTNVNGGYSFNDVFCGAYGDIKTSLTEDTKSDLYDGKIEIKQAEGVHVDCDYSFDLRELHTGADGVAYVFVDEGGKQEIYAIGTNTTNASVDMKILPEIKSQYGNEILPVTKLTSNYELPSHGNYAAFSQNSKIKSLDFDKDSNVTLINDGCFENCSELETVVVAPSVVTIGDKAFFDCTNMNNLTFDQYVENEDTVIGSHLHYIVAKAFGAQSLQKGNKITSVVFPRVDELCEYKIEVDDEAFIYADNITNIEVSDGITQFGKNVFTTSNLESLVLKPECDFNTGTATFPYYNGDKKTNYFEYNTSYSPVINYNGQNVMTDDDETVTFIRNKNGFGGNGDGLYKVYNIEGTVSTQTTTSTKIANIDVSYTCKDDSGTDITSTSTTAGSEHLGEYKIEKAFCGTTGTITAKDSASSTTKHFDSSVDLTEKITKDIDNKNLTVIEYIVESGIKYAFEGAASYVFGYTNDLGESVTILNSAHSADENKDYNVTSIAKSALKDATTLKDIVISENISSIQDSALKGCTSLDKIEFKATGATLGAEVFDFGFKDYNTDYYDVNSEGTINDAGKFKLIKNSTYGRVDAFYKLYTLSGKVTDFSDKPLVGVSIKNEDVFETNSGDGGTYSFEGVLCGSTHFDVSLEGYYEDPESPCTLNPICGDTTGGNFRLNQGTIVVYDKFNYLLCGDGADKYIKALGPTENPDSEEYKIVSFENTIKVEGEDYPVKAISLTVTLSKLEKLTIPSNVTEISSKSFKECVNLENVIFAEDSNLDTIGDSTFEGCLKLAEINFPASLKNIGEAAFKNCASLDFLLIPNNLTSIGNEAFAGCSKVDSIMFDGITSSTTVGDNVWPFHVYKFDSSTNTFVNVNEDGTIDTFGKFNVRKRNFENAAVKVFDQVFTLSGTVLLDEDAESGVTVTINDKRTGQKYDPSVPDATEDFETGVAAEEPRSYTATTNDDGNFEFPEEFAGSINNVVALDLDGVKQVSVSKFGPIVADSDVKVSLETLPVPPGPEPTPTPDPEFINSTAQTGDALTVFCVFMIAVLTFSIFVFERNRIKNN